MHFICIRTNVLAIIEDSIETFKILNVQPLELKFTLEPTAHALDLEILVC